MECNQLTKNSLHLVSPCHVHLVARNERQRHKWTQHSRVFHLCKSE